MMSLPEFQPHPGYTLELPHRRRPIVLFGAGGIVRDAHLPAYAKAGFEVASLTDLRSDRTAELAAQYGIAATHTRIEDAVAAAPADAVFDIALPPEAHIEALEALPDGAAVLLQKPLGNHLPEGIATREVCRRKKLVTAVNTQLRFAPYIAVARELIAAGAIGQLYDLEIRVQVRTPWEMFPYVLDLDLLAGAPDGHNNVYDLVLHLWRHGGELLDTDGRPVLDGVAMREALVALSELAALAPPDAHALDSTASGAAFAEGGIGFSLNWAGYAALAAAGPVADDFVCSIAPTHDDGTPTTTVNAFWAACITASTPHPGRAWAHLRHAASPAMDLAGATGCRLSTWSDAATLARHPEYALFERAHANSRPLPRSPELPALVGLLSHLVDAVVWCGAAPDPALASAQRAADELFAPRPPAPPVSRKEFIR